MFCGVGVGGEGVFGPKEIQGRNGWKVRTCLGGLDARGRLFSDAGKLSPAGANERRTFLEGLGLQIVFEVFDLKFALVSLWSSTFIYTDLRSNALRPRRIVAARAGAVPVSLCPPGVPQTSQHTSLILIDIQNASKRVAQ